MSKMFKLGNYFLTIEVMHSGRYFFLKTGKMYGTCFTVKLYDGRPVDEGGAP